MYWHLSLAITPELCKSFTKSLVISEDPLDWERRMAAHRSVRGAQVHITQYREIDAETYARHRTMNPTPPKPVGDRYDPVTCRDLVLHDRDYRDIQKGVLV